MAAMREVVHFPDEYDYLMFAKNLFYSDKKNKARMWYVCAADTTEIDLKALTKKLGCGSGNLRAASEEAMYEKLGCKKGGLNLFGLINDKEKEVVCILDKKLTEVWPYVGIHPMTNEATTAISKEAVMQIVELSQHEPQIIDFSELATAVAAAAPAGGQKQGKQGGGGGGKGGKGQAQGKGKKGG